MGLPEQKENLQACLTNVKGGEPLQYQQLAVQLALRLAAQLAVQ